jgi:hypothetical protein
MEATPKRIEEMLRDAGISPIAGVDEAGRGPCAGPLVFAAVILDNPFAEVWAEMRDSKEISEKKREVLFDVVMQSAAAVSVIEVSPEEIDLRGVHAANLDGMRRAVNGQERVRSRLNGARFVRLRPYRQVRRVLERLPDWHGWNHQWKSGRNLLPTNQRLASLPS